MAHPARSNLPRPADPIRCAADALRIVVMAMMDPPEPETIAFFIDSTSRSDTITIVSGTTDPDSVISVCECMALAGIDLPQACGLIVASVRPDADGLEPGDIDRWIDAQAITEASGIELIDWFVVTPTGVHCPRELLGDPERW